MEPWQQKLNYRYDGAHARMTFFLYRDTHLPDRVELYAWKEAGLIALVGAEDGPYCVHSRGEWGESHREVIWSNRLVEYLIGFFHSDRTYLEAWYDAPSKALIAGERRREEVCFDCRFRRVDLSSLFRVKLLNTRETGLMQLCRSLPLRLSAARRGDLLELTANMDGPIKSTPGRYTSCLAGEPLTQLCGDWDTESCWGRDCVDGWVIGPDVVEVSQEDPMRHFQGYRTGPPKKRLQAVPELYRILELKQNMSREAI